jgi:hypothetical protein
VTIPVGYSLAATTIAQLKAITPANRVNNFTLLLPATGSWYYYNATSSDTPDDLTVIQPDDGVGRWIAVSLQVILAAAANVSNSAANGAIATHEANSLNPHPQYQRTDGVYIASQPNSTTPAFTAKVATGGSSTGGFQVLTDTNNPAVALGADNRNRGVITAGNNGLMIGGNPTERIGFFGGNGGNGVTRPNAIAAPGNNTTDTRRAVIDIRSTLLALGLIAP